MSCGYGNNPTSIQFKAAFQSLLCNTVNRKDNGNCLFDDIPVIELTTVYSDCDFDFDFEFDFEKDKYKCDAFVENVLKYISGFIMRTLLKNEFCTYCYAYFKESKDRITCPLIETKQRGGLIKPIRDVVSIVKIANIFFESAKKKIIFPALDQS